MTIDKAIKVKPGGPLDFFLDQYYKRIDNNVKPQQVDLTRLKDTIKSVLSICKNDLPKNRQIQALQDSLAFAEAIEGYQKEAGFPIDIKASSITSNFQRHFGKSINHPEASFALEILEKAFVPKDLLQTEKQFNTLSSEEQRQLHSPKKPQAKTKLA